jgi:MurNAc alpha-1-phosphate uridylyltransferase
LDPRLRGDDAKVCWGAAIAVWEKGNMSGDPITRALVLAAGLGMRMRPLTDHLPKPLIKLGGQPMLDHVLDRLAEAGVTEAIVNVHYLADQVEAHVAKRTVPRITISDERAEILDTGGAVNKVLHLLGSTPFFVHNSDSVWVEGTGNTLTRMIEAWDGERMDSLLLFARADDSLGYNGRGDFHMDEAGRISRRGKDETAPYVFAGASINHPRLFIGSPAGPFSINRNWDKALASGRLAAICLEGLWMHVGTPDALIEAEGRLDGRSAA